MNPITAVERAIDFLGERFAQALKGEEGSECDATGTCAERNAARLGRAALRVPGALYAAFRAALSSDYDATRDPLWIRLLSLRPSPPHDEKWTAEQWRQADEQARTDIQRELRRRLGKDDA